MLTLLTVIGLLVALNVAFHVSGRRRITTVWQALNPVEPFLLVWDATFSEPKFSRLESRALMAIFLAMWAATLLRAAFDI